MVKLTKDAVLELDTRRRIYDMIVGTPGIHFRELQRRVTIAYGSLQYHIEFLLRHGLIEEEKGKDYSRYFPAGFKSIRERELISLLRQKSIRRILLFLLENSGSRNKDLVEAVGLSPSTVSWHMGRLIRAGAVKQQKSGNETQFCVIEPDAITRLLVTYRSSFLDEIVDRFVEVWDKETIPRTAGVFKK